MTSADANDHQLIKERVYEVCFMLTLDLSKSDEGLWAEFYFYLRQGDRHELASVKPKGFSHPIYLRRGTSDIDNFTQIFVNNEYGFVSDNPRSMVDLGGYIGLASIYVVNKFPQCSVMLVEPDPDNFTLASVNCRPYSQIKCIQAGVWSKSCNLAISEKIFGDWGTTVRELEPGEIDPDPIAALSVNDIIKRAGFFNVDFMKIDIEGPEKVIFASPDVASWVRRCGVISCELHDRIVPGCSDAFHSALSNGFDGHRHGEYDYYVNKSYGSPQFI